jgi:predicted metalloprotease with PDZ domain
LVYNATPNKDPFWADSPGAPSVYASHSLGIDVQKDAVIRDVVPGSPAYQAGLGPQMTIIAVDGRVYSTDVLVEAIAHPRNGRISMIVRNFDSVSTHEISYAGGLRYPHLERIPGTHDYLSEIFAPRPLR